MMLKQVGIPSRWSVPGSDSTVATEHSAKIHRNPAEETSDEDDLAAV